jgi:hypothetical protein
MFIVYVSIISEKKIQLLFSLFLWVGVNRMHRGLIGVQIRCLIVGIKNELSIWKTKKEDKKTGNLLDADRENY